MKILFELPGYFTPEGLGIIDMRKVELRVAAPECSSGQMTISDKNASKS